MTKHTLKYIMYLSLAFNIFIYILFHNILSRFDFSELGGSEKILS